MTWDPVWEKVYRESEWGKYPGESLIRFVARNYYRRERNKIRMLEIGCGPGANIWYIAREGFKAYGIDGSSTAIEKAKNRLRAEGLGAKLLVSDAQNLSFPEDYFDAVVDNECLAHNSASSAAKILKEIGRVLKKGGLFYSRTFTDKTYVGQSRKKLARLEYNGVSDGPFANRGFIRLTDRNSISSLYAKQFEILSVDKLEWTNENGSWRVSEWIIICKK